jgi:hypothetical protein
MLYCIDVGAACGWCGTALALVMTQMPTKKTIMGASLACSLAQCCHFFLLPGGLSGLDMQLVMVLMSIFGYYDSERWAQRCYYLLYPALLGLGLSALHTAFDALPVLASLISVYARQCRSLYKLRLLTIFSTVPWLPYLVRVKSWSNLCGMLLFTALSIVAFVRYHLPLGKRTSCRRTPAACGDQASKGVGLTRREKAFHVV